MKATRFSTRNFSIIVLACFTAMAASAGQHETPPPKATPPANTSSSDSHAEAAAKAAALAASRSAAASTASVAGSGNSATDVSNKLAQRQQQRQQQAQQQRASADGAGAGAGASAGAGAGAGAGSGNSTGQTMYAGGAAGSGDSYTALALPSVPMTPPSVVAGAVVSTTVSKCGPLQRVVAESIYGEHSGIFSNDKVWLGNTEKTDNYLDENGKWQLYIANGGRWNGHEVIYSTAALSVSSASNLTIGGGSAGGGWGQGGGGVSGAMQRMVTTIQLRLCDAGAVYVAPRVIYVEPERPAPVRKPVVRRAKPTCVKTTLPICKAS